MIPVRLDDNIDFLEVVHHTLNDESNTTSCHGDESDNHAILDSGDARWFRPALQLLI
jgi:hypothetical protein